MIGNSVVPPNVAVPGDDQLVEVRIVRVRVVEATHLDLQDAGGGPACNCP